jgi:hypothetical protein
LAFVFVHSVRNLLGIQSEATTPNAKDVIDTMSTSNQGNSLGPNMPDKSNSAQIAPPEYAFAVKDLDPNNVKCTKCNEVTTHQAQMVAVVPLLRETNIDDLQKAKRLTMCTKCGHLSITK